ncbi:MAG: ATP-binding protein [Bacteroidota bacterium]
MTEHKYKANCSKDQLRKIRAFVREVLQEYSVSEIRINELILAVDEVCANLIIHSCSCDPNYSIDLIIKKDSENIIFEFVNRGESFDILHYEEPKIEELIQSKRKGGLGLMLVNRIMDKIEHEQTKGSDIYRMYKAV